MSTASTARRRSRSRAWLRVLVLLLALLVPGAHTQAHAALPTAAGVSGSSVPSGELAEHDVLDTVLRPSARPDRRSTTRPGRPGPGPLPRAARDARPCPARPAPPRPSYASHLPRLPHVLRTVVLRC